MSEQLNPKNFTPSEKQLLKTLRHLEKKGKDVWGNIGQVALTAIGALAGSSGAGWLFAYLGYATTTIVIPATLFGSTALAAFFGMEGTPQTIENPTPDSWKIWGAVLVGLIAFALSCFVRHAGAQDEIRKRMQMDIRAELEKFKTKPSDDNEKSKMIGKVLQASMYQQAIPSSDIARMIQHLNDGSMTPEYALEVIQSAVSPEVKNSRKM